MSEEEKTETQLGQQTEEANVSSQVATSEVAQAAEDNTNDGNSEANQVEQENAAPKDVLSLDDNGEIKWNDETIAKLVAGKAHLEPEFTIIREEINNNDETRAAVTERLSNWLEDMLHTDLFSLFRLKSAIEHVASEQDATVAPSDADAVIDTTATDGEVAPKVEQVSVPHVLSNEAKALAQKILDASGILNRNYVDREVAALSQEVRKSLRVLGLRFGRSAVYFPLLLKPKAVRLNAILGFYNDGATADAPFLPPVGVTSFAADDARSEKEYDLIGFRNIAGRAIRIDILDRVLDALYEAQKEAKGPIAMPQAVVSFLGVSNEIAEQVVEALNWVKQTDEEGKVTWTYRRPKPQRNFKPRINQGNAADGQKRENSYKRPERSGDRNFGDKKRRDKNHKPKQPHNYSVGPKKVDGDSPFAVLASLKLDGKKED